jgi:hypothetical protein
MQKKSSTSRERTATKTYAEQHRAITRRIAKAEENDVYDCILAEQRRMVEARAVYDVIQVCSPDFIAEGLMKLIDDAANWRNLPKPTFDDGDTETPEQAIKKIADIFTMAFDFKPPAKTLAELIVAVIEHEDCPQEITDAMNEATSDLFNRLNEGDRRLYFTAPYIHALIVESKAQEGSVS